MPRCTSARDSGGLPGVTIPIVDPGGATFPMSWSMRGTVHAQPGSEMAILEVGVEGVAVVRVAAGQPGLEPLLALLRGAVFRKVVGDQLDLGRALVAGAALVIAVGIALNGSLAGYGLAIPVLLASVVIAFPGRASLRWLTLLAAILMIGAVGWLSTMPVGSSTARASAETSVQSRHDMLVTSLEAAKRFMPFGSGVGSFRRVYALYEDHDRLDPTTFVNHAHDDYVELAVETGVPGVILLAAFLLWWANAAWAAWRRPRPDPFALAASVASAAVLLHSVVDFPLRTAAISACFAMCLVLLIRQRRAPPADPAQLRPTRHVVVG